MNQLTRTRPTTQVNLLPPETKEQQKAKRQVGLVAMCGAAVVGLLVLFSMVQGAKIGDLDDRLAEVSATNATLQDKAVRMQRFEALRQSRAARLALVQGALSGGIRWSRVLQDVSRSMPDDLWLTSIEASMGETAVTPTDPSIPVPPPTTTSGQAVATLTFTAMALDVPRVSEWLQKLEAVDGWANAYATSVTQAQGTSQVIYEVTATVDMTADYVAKNGSDS